MYAGVKNFKVCCSSTRIVLEILTSDGWYSIKKKKKRESFKSGLNGTKVQIDKLSKNPPTKRKTCRLSSTSLPVG